MKRLPAVAAVSFLSGLLMVTGGALARPAGSVPIEWTKQFGASGFDVARAVGVEGTNVYVLGAASGPLPGQGYAGGPDDVVLIRYDLAGTEIWTRQFGTAGNDFPAAGQVGIDETGVYIAGFTDGTLPGEQPNVGGEDGFVRKYDFAGNILWTDQFGTACNEEPNGLAVVRESIFVVWDTGTGGPCTGDGFIRRYDTTGNVIWTRQFGGEDAEFFVGVDADGSGIYVSGVTELQDGSGDWEALAGKYDFDGNLIWMDQFGTASRDELEAVAVRRGAVYVAGFTFGTLGDASAGSADIVVRRYDTAGNVIWTRQFGSPGNDSASFRGLAVDSNSVYVTGNVAGALPGQTSAGSRDGFMRRYSADGEPILTTQFGTTGDDRAIAVAIDADDVYLAGRTSGSFPGYANAGGFDGFVVKIDLDG
jgi:hypothetical protein